MLCNPLELVDFLKFFLDSAEKRWQKTDALSIRRRDELICDRGIKYSICESTICKIHAITPHIYFNNSVLFADLLLNAGRLRPRAFQNLENLK